MLQVPDGALTAVERPVAELEALMSQHGVHLSAVNAERSSVLGGTKEAVEALEAELRLKDIPFTRLATEKAFHTPAVEPICAPFEQAIQHHQLADARVRMVSTVTADWVKPGELSAASYWARQIRQPVRFAASTALLAKQPRPIFLEVGPQTFTGALQRAGATAAAVLPRPRDRRSGRSRRCSRGSPRCGSTRCRSRCRRCSSGRAGASRSPPTRSSARSTGSSRPHR